MRYVAARYRQEAELYSYRLYVTDALRMQGENKYPSERWADLIKPKQPAVEDARPCGEIVNDMWERIKGE